LRNSVYFPLATQEESVHKSASSSSISPSQVEDPSQEGTSSRKSEFQLETPVAAFAHCCCLLFYELCLKVLEEAEAECC